MTARDRGPVRPDELDGYATGVALRLDERRRAGTPVPEGERLLREGHAALARRDFPAADRALRAADALVDAATPQDVVSQAPRGLIRYAGPGAPERATPREEDPLANRALIAQRLLAVRRSQGHPVEPLVAALREAETAYSRGDRARARQLIDEVQAALHALDGSTRRPTE